MNVYILEVQDLELPIIVIPLEKDYIIVKTSGLEIYRVSRDKVPELLGKTILDVLQELAKHGIDTLHIIAEVRKVKTL